MGHQQPAQPVHYPAPVEGAIGIGHQAPADPVFADLRVGMTVPLVESGSQMIAAHATSAPCRGARLTSLRWSTSTPQPAPHGATTSMVTRWRHAGTTGLIHTETYTRDDNERELEFARATWTVDAPGGQSSGARIAWDVASPEWTERIAARLHAHHFAAATEAFDGTIGLEAGDTQTYFRIHRGNLIEAGRKPLDGPTFTVHATESTWIGMLAARRSDYVRRAGQGQFTSTGSSFQYLRMFKAIMLILEAARAEVREAAHA